MRIDDPQQLAQDVTDWLTKEARLRGTPVVECWPVRYDKGERSAEITDHLERTRLNYTQKPRSYETEYEYRFAVVASPDFDGRMGLREYHDVVLGHPLPYAELL